MLTVIARKSAEEQVAIQKQAYKLPRSTWAQSDFPHINQMLTE